MSVEFLKLWLSINCERVLKLEVSVFYLWMLELLVNIILERLLFRVLFFVWNKFIMGWYFKKVVLKGIMILLGLVSRVCMFW